MHYHEAQQHPNHRKLICQTPQQIIQTKSRRLVHLQRNTQRLWSRYRGIPITKRSLCPSPNTNPTPIRTQTTYPYRNHKSRVQSVRTHHIKHQQ